MLAFFRFVTLCFALCLGVSAHAELVAVPALKQHVTDLTATLDASQQAALEAKLQQLEAKKGSQVAVLVVPTTQPEDIAQFANRVAMTWKLGRKQAQDGVLLVVAKQDRKLRIEVDSGLQGAITDIYAKRIIAETISPAFKQGDFYGGVNAGIDKIIALIEGETLPPPQPQANKQMTLDNSIGLFIILCFILGGFLSDILGKFFGASATGGIVGGIAWLIAGTMISAVFVGFIAFIFTLFLPSLFGGNSTVSSGGYYGGGGSSSWGGGSSSWGGGGSSGWSGGGASGDW